MFYIDIYVYIYIYIYTDKANEYIPNLTPSLLHLLGACNPFSKSWFL